MRSFQSVSRYVFPRLLAFGTVLSLFTFTASSNAQTSPTGASESPISQFNAESVVPLDQIGSAAALSLAPDLLASIQGGALEIHQTLVFDTSAMVLRVRAFATQTKSPLPTPTGAQGLIQLWSYDVAVSDVRVNSKKKTVSFFGTVAVNGFPAPFGDLTGSTVVASAAYASGDNKSTTFTYIDTDIVGTASVVSKSGAGAVIPVTASTVPVAVAGPKGTQVTAPSFALDASGSSDPSGGTLTYQWTFLPILGQTVDLSGANTAKPMVTLPDGASFGTYTFQLTVTNSSGQSSNDTVVVNYIDPNS